MITHNQIFDGLTFLGFVSGFAIGGEPAEIVLWENPEPQPSYEKIEAAAVAGAFDRAVAECELQRKTAYQSDADPLFFKWQAGDGTEEEWLAKRAEIAERFPYPVKEEVTPEPLPEEPTIVEETK